MAIPPRARLGRLSRRHRHGAEQLRMQGEQDHEQHGREQDTPPADIGEFDPRAPLGGHQ